MNDSSNGNHGRAHDHQPRDFFGWVRALGLVRPEGAWLGGVCAAVAARTRLDVMVVRGIAIVIAILGGPIFLAYAAAWALLPDARGRIHLQQLIRGEFNPVIIAIAICFALTFMPFAGGLWWQGPPAFWGMPEWLAITLRAGWGLVLLAGLVLLTLFLVARARRTPATWQAPPPAPPSSTGGAFTAGPAGQPAGSSRPATAAHDTAAQETAQQSEQETVEGAPATAPGDERPADDGPDPERSWSENFSESADRWGRSFSERADEWGRGVGEKADAWGHRVGEHADRIGRDVDATVSKAVERWQARRPGAAFVAVSLGLAFIAGAVALGLHAVTTGSLDRASFAIGLAAGTGMLGLAIVAAGIRGRSSGSLGFFSVVAIVALVIVGLIPRTTQFLPFGQADWTVRSQAGSTGQGQGFGVIAGSMTIDAEQLRSADPGDVVEVWMGFGQTRLVLPDGVPVRVETNGVISSVNYPESATRTGSGGILIHDHQVLGGTGERGADDVPVVRVWTLVGNVDVDLAADARR